MKRFSDCVGGVLTSLMLAPPVRAAATVSTSDVASFSDLENMVKRVIMAVGALAGVGLFIALVVGGFTFLFSGGDAKKLEQARNGITYAIIGIVVVAAAYLIIQLLAQFTGVTSIKTFNLNLQ